MANKPIRLLLDPGHNYATYNRSPVVPAYYEGARMWRLYQFLRPALERRGFIVGCTKTKCDQTVSVTQRGAMARGYDALVSLHSNAERTGKVDRPVGIYVVDDNCGSVDDESKALAKLLSDTVAEVMSTSPAQQYSKLSKNDRDHDGKLNDDYYGVLFASHQAGVPAVILEHSFHTNKQAATWLLSDDNLRRLAEAEADALAEYYNMTGVKDTTPPIQREGTPVEMISLRPGDKNAQVKTMQAILRGFGYTDNNGKAIAVDGSFGPKTEQALRKYQAANKDADGNQLKADGKCGPKTWGSMLAQ